MTQSANEISSEPKDIRMEVRLTGAIKEKLEFCSKVFGFSKGQVIRMGIEEIYKRAEYENEKGAAKMDLEKMVEQAEIKRGEKIRKEVYQETYAEAYSTEYARLIVDPNYAYASEAKEDAKEYAREVASDAVQDALDDFWTS